MKLNCEFSDSYHWDFFGLLKRWGKDYDITVINWSSGLRHYGLSRLHGTGSEDKAVGT